MEMDSSRRPFDRSSQPGMKKPRLTEDPLIRNTNSNANRPIVQRPPAAGAATGAVGTNGAGSARFRAGGSDRDRDSESSGGGYQPQPVQHQELISQYRTALAELTFNSKPIITNLTIIAGENLLAAKAIVATVCNNIIEVPSDQKLPSLYLLDSIVKNIGKDYIKYFAVRLPEVFCKAYKQVDPATHPNMRHLFGTWKGVFPLQSLQMIEKELGFVPAANGSSSGTTTSKPDSNSQRPAHSIHVNPKYLAARQQLQTRPKGSGNDVTANLANEDTERLERTATISSSGRSRADPRLKMLNNQQSQRNVVSEPVRENNIGATYGDFEYNSDVSRHSDVNFGKSVERVTEQGFDKSWYGAVNNSTETLSTQRNGFDAKHGLSNYPAAKYANADGKLQPMPNMASRNSSGLSKSWKNSEEEEYMWDDINSKSTNHGLASNSRKDPRLPAESERLVSVKKDFENHIHKAQGTHDIVSRVDRESSSDSMSTEQKDQANFGRRVSSPWPQEPHTNAGPSYSGSARNMSGRPEVYSTSFSGSTHLGDQNFGITSNNLQGQQRRNFGGTSPSGQSIMPQHPPSPSFSYNPNQPLPNVTEQEHPSSHLQPRADSKAARSQGQFNVSTHSQDSLQSLPPNANSNNSQRLQLHNLQAPHSIRPPFQPRQHNSFPQPLQSETVQPELSVISQKSLLPQIPVAGKPLTSLKSLPDHSKPHVSDISRHSSTKSLLAAVVSSGILGSKSVNSSLPDSAFKSEVSAPPLLPSGPPPTKFTSSAARDSSSSLYSPSSHEISPLSQRKTDKLPLIPGPPPSLIGSASAPASSASNPVSSLLSTLVAKGLISASKGDSSTSTQTSTETQSKSLKCVTSKVAVPSASVSSALPPLSISDAAQLSVSAKSSTALPQSTKTEIKSLIGFDFRPDVIRETHPSVISELIDDLPHQCSICGLRFKLQERYDRHIEWHTSRNTEPKSSDQLSRRWYTNSVDWVTGKAVVQSTSGSMDLNEGSEKDSEISTEPMVSADESQCVCILCGEVFEDFYSQERDEWMFKGAVYLTNNTDGKAGNNSEDATTGPIVHAHCISESSLPDLGLVNDVQLKKGT